MNQSEQPPSYKYAERSSGVHSLLLPVGIVEFPGHFFSLNQDDITKLSSSPSAGSMIVAAGIDSRDGCVTFITALGEVKIFDPKQYSIPAGLYVPISCGDEIMLPNLSDRWPEQISEFFIKSTWLLDRTRSAIDETSIQLQHTYYNENDCEKTETTDP
jgi:hypothetical protein